MLRSNRAGGAHQTTFLTVHVAMGTRLTPHAPGPRTEDNRDPDPDSAHKARDERGGVERCDAIPEHAERLEERHAPAKELGLDSDDYRAEGDDHYHAGEKRE